MSWGGDGYSKKQVPHRRFATVRNDMQFGEDRIKEWWMSGDYVAGENFGEAGVITIFAVAEDGGRGKARAKAEAGFKQFRADLRAKSEAGSLRQAQGRLSPGFGPVRNDKSKSKSNSKTRANSKTTDRSVRPTRADSTQANPTQVNLTRADSARAGSTLARSVAEKSELAGSALWSGLTPKELGEIAEADFLAKASGMGIWVAKPWGDSRRYDFIVDCGGRLRRVQVKSAYREGKDGGYSLRTHGHSGRAYRVSEIDALVGYVAPERAWYVLPVEVVRRLRSLKLYPGSRGRRSKFERYREAWEWLQGVVGDGKSE